MAHVALLTPARRGSDKKYLEKAVVDVNDLGGCHEGVYQSPNFARKSRKKWGAQLMIGVVKDRYDMSDIRRRCVLADTTRAPEWTEAWSIG